MILNDVRSGVFETRVGSGDRDHPGPHFKGPTMSDKSPRSTMSKKAGKSLKEKRADKRTKADTTSATEDAIRKKR
jgi:hypothetical protein